MVRDFDIRLSRNTTIFTRRQALTVLGLSSVVRLRAQDAAPAATANLPIAQGKFQPNDESFKQYLYPDWFRDAKFGMWAHWGDRKSVV